MLMFLLGTSTLVILSVIKFICDYAFILALTHAPHWIAGMGECADIIE